MTWEPKNKLDDEDVDVSDDDDKDDDKGKYVINCNSIGAIKYWSYYVYNVCCIARVLWIYMLEKRIIDILIPN